MSNNNPTGINGHGAKNYPDDEILMASLFQYAKERLGTAQRLARLEAEHNLVIKDQTLYKLNRKFKVPSVRRPPPDDIATQAVLEKVANDPSQRRGVGTISTLLSNEGVAIPRDFIRNVLATYAPEGLARRFPGVNRIPRSKLSALGPNHQHHADGHEKLNAQALNMGGVGLNIYGVKDQWSSYILHLVVVPNNRLATTIGHVYLDAVEKYELIPITFVTDKGSETGFLYANQTALREAYAPEIDKEQFPPMLQMRSVHNTPIEGLWHWQLFYWLWPKILQIQLDQFVEYWNNHRIRAQADKPNMSGSTPRHAFTVPDLPAQQCGITVDQAVIDALRHQIPVSRKDSMRWVDDEFEVAATMAFSSIGEPPLSNLLSGWKIFTSMARVINVASSPT
ncbi:hypothetical protein CPB84DRAFT_1816716 [Gymnopilus junonius]|uniref:Integrase catalytic domain-containing protein n=1 Tax=Gymnopilus junonius TaxID=109634 RepID=A0A9P5NH93_GYMJU|nr:hypothetical protein CPB84DRAFT_1816716 [Gymnopilus junonius]